jgi:elongation factor G
MSLPQQVVFVTIEPQTKSDGEKLVHALEKLMAEDPAMRVSRDAPTGGTIIRGTSEQHLEIIIDRLVREFGVEANVGKPQVVYRETISVAAEAEGKFIRQSGGRGEYAHVVIRLTPREVEAGFEFVNAIVGGVIPGQHIKSIEQGIKDAMESGILAGCEVVDIQATVFDGSYHEVDSSDMAFKLAAAEAYKEAARQASPVVLEPIMTVEVVVAEELMGPVAGDLCSRRARIEGMERRGTTQAIKATAPLAEMLGYATDLRSRTNGRASYSMHFDRYEPVPRGFAPNDEDRSAPVVAPRTPAPKGKNSSIALPEPD